MRQIATTFFILILLTCSAGAQLNMEYGQPEELKGVKKIYVYTGMDLSGRENIIKVLKKDLPNVDVVSSASEAEVMLIYASDSYSVLSSMMRNSNSSTTGTISTYGNQGTYSGRTTTTSNTTPIYRNITDGSGFVVRFTSDGRPRLLMNFEDSRKSVLERRPSTNFVRKFIKSYKGANQ